MVLESALASGREEGAHTCGEKEGERERLGSPEVSISPAVKEQSSLEAQSCRSARHSSLSPFRCTPIAAGALQSTSARVQHEPGQTQLSSNYFQAQVSFSLPILSDGNQKSAYPHRLR